MTTDGKYTIQEVAEKTGLSVHTLRYYERIGLLDDVPRAENSHRRYTDENIQRLTFLTKLRATGMPIRGMQRWTALYLQGTSTIPTRRELLEHHQREVEARIGELQANLEAIQRKIALYREMEESHEPEGKP